MIDQIKSEVSKGLKKANQLVTSSIPNWSSFSINNPFSSSLQQQQESLTQSVENLLLQKQYDTAYYKLPVVIKEIQSTPGKNPPHGLYYINRMGKKIYLKESQKQKWKNGQEIAGCIKGCNPHDMMTGK